MPNINAPLPFNASPKPLIQAGFKGATVLTTPTSTGYSATAAILATGTQVVGANPFSAGTSVDEGQIAYAVFKFVNPDNTANLAELRDTASVTVSFDGISVDDWAAGSFKYATVDSTGAISAFTAVGATGVISFTDLQPLNPYAGSGVYGIVLAVEVKTDALVESGEHVLFKVTQDTASGSAFTQSNYTESKVVVVDEQLTVSTIGINTTPVNPVFTQSAVSDSGLGAVSHAPSNSSATAFADTFDLNGTSGMAQSLWGSTTYFTNIVGFGATDRDVLKVDFSGATAPGFSWTNFGNLSPAISNEMYLVAGLRALDGYDMNTGGMYSMQVNDATGGGFSTYLLIDTNRNGKVDAGAVSVTEPGDLLVRLAGVDVSTLQSTNFMWTA